MSILFKFSVAWTPESGESFSAFELGDMHITGRMGTVSSAGRIPDQSMMVIVSLTLLLDGLRQFLVEGKPRFEFHSVDSSFRVEFCTLPNYRVRVASSGTIVDEVQSAELIQAVTECALDVLTEWSPFLPSDAAALRDLQQAVHEFVRFKESRPRLDTRPS